MRFMMIVKASKESEAGVLPTEKELADMAKYNEELLKAGVLLAGEGIAVELERRPGPLFRGQAHRHRRAVRGSQGAHRRFLVDPGQIKGRGARVGAARAIRRRRRSKCGRCSSSRISGPATPSTTTSGSRNS